MATSEDELDLSRYVKMLADGRAVVSAAGNLVYSHRKTTNIHNVQGNDEEINARLRDAQLCAWELTQTMDMMLHELKKLRDECKLKHETATSRVNNAKRGQALRRELKSRYPS